MYIYLRKPSRITWLIVLAFWNKIMSPFRSGLVASLIPSTTPTSLQKPNERLHIPYVSSLAHYYGYLDQHVQILLPSHLYPFNMRLIHLQAIFGQQSMQSSTLKALRTEASHSWAKNSNLSAHLHFPVNPSILLPLTITNWELQNKSIPYHNHPQELLFFSTCLLSGFIIYYNGPLHRVSKQHKVTAQILAEAEIYATYKCVNALLRLQHIFDDMDSKVYISYLLVRYNSSTTIMHVISGVSSPPPKDSVTWKYARMPHKSLSWTKKYHQPHWRQD